MELMTYKETNRSRIYSFVEFNEATGIFIKRQLENRDGKILMRAKRRVLSVDV